MSTKKKWNSINMNFVLIFVQNIEENDIEIAKKLKEMDKAFCFVRSKHDLDNENAKNYGVPEAKVIERIKSKSLDILRQKGFKEANLFVISNRSRKPIAFCTAINVRSFPICMITNLSIASISIIELALSFFLR
jgi:hypothetical protein